MASYRNEYTLTCNLGTVGDASSAQPPESFERYLQVVPEVTEWGHGPALVEVQWASTSSGYQSFDPPVYMRENTPTRVIDITTTQNIRVCTVTAGGTVGAVTPDAAGTFRCVFSSDHKAYTQV